MSVVSTTCPTRADLAVALVDVVDTDSRLASALAVNAAWEFGYIADILTSAEILAAVADDNAGLCGGGSTSTEERARHAVREALGNANPISAADRLSQPPTERILAPFSEMLATLARFFESAGALERRGLRRVPPPV